MSNGDLATFQNLNSFTYPTKFSSDYFGSLVPPIVISVGLSILLAINFIELVPIENCTPSK